MSHMKGVGRIFHQTSVDTHSKSPSPCSMTERPRSGRRSLEPPRHFLLRRGGIKLRRVLTDRGTEYCGDPERHEYKLYLAVDDIDHSSTKAKSPQTNGIVERFRKTILNEFSRIAFRIKLYGSITELQADLDQCLEEFNHSRPHQGRWCFGTTPCRPSLTQNRLRKKMLPPQQQQTIPATLPDTDCQIKSWLIRLVVSGDPDFRNHDVGFRVARTLDP